jgi:hypothetical protein
MHRVTLTLTFGTINNFLLSVHPEIDNFIQGQVERNVAKTNMRPCFLSEKAIRRQRIKF